MWTENRPIRVDSVEVVERRGLFHETTPVTKVYMSRLNREGTARETFLMETPGSYTKAEIVSMFRLVSDIDETKSQ